MVVVLVFKPLHHLTLLAEAGSTSQCGTAGTSKRIL